jgi:hypothetical protein
MLKFPLSFETKNQKPRGFVLQFVVKNEIEVGDEWSSSAAYTCHMFTHKIEIG